MKRYMAVPWIVFLTLAFVGVLYGQYGQSPVTGQQEQTEALKTASGEVVSSTGDSLVIDATTGERMTFTVDEETDAPPDLVAGARVSVQYRELENGAFHAVAINMTGGSESPTSTAPETDPSTGSSATAPSSDPSASAPSSGSSATPRSSSPSATARDSSASATGSTSQTSDPVGAGERARGTETSTTSTAAARSSAQQGTGSALQSQAEQLPATASPLALAFLVGTAALGGGLGLRFYSRRQKC